MFPGAAPEAFAAAAFVALVALAGAQAGPAAMLLGVPAGIVVALLARRRAVRERSLRRLSQQDALTGVANRRVLGERLAYEIARHRRADRPFAVLALDLDGFKGVNDRYGHQAGDEVLRDVAQALERTVRDADTLARMGGDEFCVLAPESADAEAARLARRLQRAVAGAVSGLDGLAVSVGHAVFPHDGTTPDELLGAADAAAIEAKRLARERRRLAA